MQPHPHNPADAHRWPFLTGQNELFDQYYRDLQAKTGRLIPRRSQISPRDAKPILPYFMILEFVDRDTLIMRLGGTAFLNRIGVNATGSNIFALMAEADREDARENIARIFAKPCASRLIHHERYANRTVPVELTSYPFTDDNDIPRFLVGLSVELDFNELLLRGNDGGDFGALSDRIYIDIGAGT